MDLRGWHDVSGVRARKPQPAEPVFLQPIHAPAGGAPLCPAPKLGIGLVGRLSAGFFRGLAGRGAAQPLGIGAPGAQLPEDAECSGSGAAGGACPLGRGAQHCGGVAALRQPHGGPTGARSPGHRRHRGRPFPQPRSVGRHPLVAGALGRPPLPAGPAGWQPLPPAAAGGLVRPGTAAAVLRAPHPGFAGSGGHGILHHPGDAGKRGRCRPEGRSPLYLFACAVAVGECAVYAAHGGILRAIPAPGDGGRPVLVFGFGAGAELGRGYRPRDRCHAAGNGPGEL